MTSVSRYDQAVLRVVKSARLGEATAPFFAGYDRESQGFSCLELRD